MLFNLDNKMHRQELFIHAVSKIHEKIEMEITFFSAAARQIT
jgi:hypothetical protein